MSQLQHPKKIHKKYDSKVSVFERLGTKPTKLGSENWVHHDTIPSPSKLKLSEVKRVLGNMKKAKHGKKVKVKHRKSRSEKLPDPTEAQSLLVDLDLEGADEKFLQKRRLQLQRELRLQLKREKSSTGKKAKKTAREYSSSSDSSSDSSSSSSSTSSSYLSKRNENRKRKASPSSDSDDSIPEKKRKSPKANLKSKVDVKKKIIVHRKVETPKKQIVTKKSESPGWDKRPSPAKKRSPPRSKPRPSSPKHRVREPSPKRPVKPKERRLSPPPRPVRPRSPDRRPIKHSPRPRHGGLEKGGKILPVKSSAYMKEMKETFKRKTPERLREEKEKERLKEKRRREQKAREQTDRRDREREAEKAKREAERQKERDDALQRCRERQRERERQERIEREKRIKDFERKEESRKGEVKNDLPSLLDIKTEAPKEQGRRGWDERRQRRPADNFDFRRMPRSELDLPDDRRGRKGHDYVGESWGNKDDFHDAPPPPADWGRDWKQRPFDGKWGGEGGRDGNWRERERDREHYPGRRPPDWHAEPPPIMEPSPPRPPPVDHSRRPPPEAVVEPPAPSDAVAVDKTADLEEVLSDISDDADEILNQVDDVPDEPIESTPSQIVPDSISQPSADFFFDSRRPLLDCLSDRGLDFEEISDEELEEEAKMSKGIMDVLGADWESLMSKAPVKKEKVESDGSARRRWRADCIISRIGISHELAGEEFMKKYLDQIQAEENEMPAKTDPDLKKFKSEQVDEEELNENKGESIKLENEEASGKEGAAVTLQHACAAVHAMLAELPEPSPLSRLLNSKFKHALSARTDLAIRRVACGLSSKEPLQLPACDTALYETSLALFKSAVA